MLRVIGGVEAVTSIDGVGEDEIIWTGEETAASPFSSCNFLLFKFEVSWERGSFFIPLIRAYFYYTAWPSLCTHTITSCQLKKKNVKSAFFCGPHVPPPNPTTHHSHPLNFTHLSSLFWPALSFLSFIFSFFILLKHTHTHTHRPASTPNHTISPSFFRQDHRKNT